MITKLGNRSSMTNLNWTTPDMKMDIQYDGQNAKVRLLQLPTGDLLPALVKLEKQCGNDHITSLELDFGELHYPEERLRKLSYRAIPHHPGQFRKNVHYQRSVRFSITEKCNYHCFFCHEEGMEMQKERSASNLDQLHTTLDQLAALEYQDFTFTGGEPLLNKNRILECLDYMQNIGYHPDITIVTNGIPLNEPFLHNLARYPNLVRFNISVHSMEKDSYDDIVQNLSQPDKPLRQEFYRLQDNLELLQKHGYPFKLNVVLLKGLNTSDEAIQAMFDFALATGATSIKFLELLLTRDLSHFYPYFYKLDAVRERFQHQLNWLDEDNRRSYWRYRDTDLVIEFQQCTCSRGCNICPVNRATNFTAELKYFPCFLHPEQDFDLNTTDLASALQQGENMIDNMAARFGDHSPIIIRDAHFNQSERHYYYEISSHQLDILKQAWQLEQSLFRRRRFTEYYREIHYNQPTTGDVRIDKISHDHHEHSSLHISQIICAVAGSPAEIETRFLQKGSRAANPQELAKTTALNAPWELTLEWDISHYRYAPQDGTTPLELSVSLNSDSGIYLIRSPMPLTDPPCELRPLTKVPFEWVRYRRRIL
tara:strand:- start:14866 stop:16650 length:1785 start_codon:yes stop_codon:yes gene_type:complete